jgi:hypothetical protein
VYAFDPLAGSPSADAVPAAVRGRFAGPVGLLAARSAAATLPVNFVQPRQPRGEPGKARSRVLLAALVAVVLFGMGGALAFLELEKAGRAVRDKTAMRDDLKQQLEAVEVDGKRLAAADEFANREVVVLDQLYDFADRVPDVSKVTVAEFELAAVPPPKKDVRPGAIVPPAAKNAPPPPVANLKVTMRSQDPVVAQRVFDSFRGDRYYAGATRVYGTVGGGADRGQSSILAAQVLGRKPGEYSRVLRVQPPAAPPAAGGERVEFTGGFGGEEP